MEDFISHLVHSAGNPGVFLNVPVPLPMKTPTPGQGYGFFQGSDFSDPHLPLPLPPTGNPRVLCLMMVFTLMGVNFCIILTLRSCKTVEKPLRYA
jgi:hypothetical protein